MSAVPSAARTPQLASGVSTPGKSASAGSGGASVPMLEQGEVAAKPWDYVVEEVEEKVPEMVKR